MNGNLRYQYPPVFTVDASGGLPQQHHQMTAARTEPALVPCWTFPPARAQPKRRGCGGLTSAAGTLLVMVLVVVFAALGLGAYQIKKLEMEVVKLKHKQEMDKQTETNVPQKLVGNQIEKTEKANLTQAAHVIGKIQDKASKTLQWESRHGRVITKGIQYRDGHLQVNRTGLYFVYSRVEFLSNNCQMRESLVHEVFVKSNGKQQKLMSDHRVGYCQAGSTEVWTSGSNLGSVQELKQGDLVFVYVSDPKLLSSQYHDNYFGIFNLS